MARINHNTTTPGYTSLKAIPIDGTVRVQLLSGTEVIDETKTQANGDWEKSFDVPDGSYIVRFRGLFHPIGGDKNTKYLSRVTTKDVPLSVTTQEPAISLGHLRSVKAGSPQKNVFFGSDGQTWNFQSIPERLVDLSSVQTVPGAKTFSSETVFQDVITVGKSIKFQGSVPDGIVSSSVPDSYIYVNTNNELVFSDSRSGVRTFSSLMRLSEMTDVVSGIPSQGNLLSGDGTHWTSLSPVALGILTTSDAQSVAGEKTFLNGISVLKMSLGSVTDGILSDNATISLSGDQLKFVDAKGSYTLDDLATVVLEDLDDINDATPTAGNLLIANGNQWASATPDDANLMTKTGEQDISGNKRFSGNITLDGELSGASVLTDLSLASSSTVATSLSIKQYIDSIPALDTDIVLPTSVPSSIEAGSIYADIDNKSIMFYDGSAWQSADCPKYIYVKAAGQSAGDIHLSDATNWNASKSIIKHIRVETTSTDWDIWILQNDNGYVANDANIKRRLLASNRSGDAYIDIDILYHDEDNTKEVHLYYTGSNVATITIQGIMAR